MVVDRPCPSSGEVEAAVSQKTKGGGHQYVHLVDNL